MSALSLSALALEQTPSPDKFLRRLQALALEQTRLRELWLQRLSAHDLEQARLQSLTQELLRRGRSAPYLLGTPSNVLASGAQEWCPEWHLQYRLARDGLAYSREEFKSYYGCERFLAYWDEAAEATEEQKHESLLSVLRSHCDQVRMRKVAAAFRSHTLLDDDLIENIASFVSSGSADRPR